MEGVPCNGFRGSNKHDGVNMNTCEQLSKPVEGALVFLSPVVADLEGYPYAKNAYRTPQSIGKGFRCQECSPWRALLNIGEQTVNYTRAYSRDDLPVCR